MDIPETAQVALEVSNHIIAISCDSKTPFVSLLYPYETILVLRFVHEERD
jgi:hypothetical protein